ncbi:ArsR/SmtB family transcription factor [Mesorhizobium amorphae]|uniref:ArsR/SmtB family transcription factor n=1 Tax=Mesorhizobium amorphae TaxID=71433 RepID=UPI0011827EEF|nr:metalloregulator ArsR/SmtB family transcription factor [Mesorhizobium amorphae]
MTDADSHHPLFDLSADIARTLGHAHRLVLLHHIAEGEKAVEQLTELTSLSVANASQHLQGLKRAGLVQTRRDGKRVLYRLGSGPIEALLAALRSLAAYNSVQIRDLIAGSTGRSNLLESITREELLRRMREDSIVLLDVRPEDEFVAGHLPQAINIPVEELENRLAELPREKLVVAYCRGIRCVLSADALAILKARGWIARRFELGFPDWLDAGLAIEGYESG